MSEKNSWDGTNYNMGHILTTKFKSYLDQYFDQFSEMNKKSILELLDPMESGKISILILKKLFRGTITDYSQDIIEHFGVCLKRKNNKFQEIFKKEVNLKKK